MNSMRERRNGDGWVRVGGSGRRKDMGNYDQNILYEKNYYKILDDTYFII